MEKIKIHLIWLCFVPLILNAQQKNDNIILSLVKTQLGDDVSTDKGKTLQLKVNDFHQSEQSKLEHYYFRQTINNLEVIGTQSSIHLKTDGTVFKFNNKLSTELPSLSTAPVIDPVQAVTAAGKHLWYSDLGNIEVLEHSISSDRSQKISKGKLSRKEIPVKLVYQLKSDGNLALAWDLSIHETKKEEWWSMRVDAKTGEILEKDSWMAQCNFEHKHSNHKCTKQSNDHAHSELSKPKENLEEMTGFVGGYRVFALPLAHPGEGGRTLVNNPDNGVASPYGWHDTNGSPGSEFTITRGNNAHAFDSGNNAGYSPSGGGGLVFDFPLNLNGNPDSYENAGITNLFYWNNLAHDIFYQYGFNEASGNFQQNNYNKGGSGNDYVIARSQIGTVCNAFFGTPPEGTGPTMSMYVCNGRDGDYSNLVILHEYGHGLSNRLTGGANNSGCLNNAEQMGEGWSDYVGLMLTMKSGDQGTDARVVGDWLFNNSGGIRPHPYSTNMGINPHTYASSFSGTSQPHGIGSVWCMMVWEMTWALIAQYGYDSDIYNGNGGNNIAIQLVIEGLKLQPCSPGFVDGRNAVLAADQALYNGANQCLIWNAFAKRGLGVGANQGSSNNRSDGNQAFNVPASCVGCPTNLTLTGTISTTINYEAQNNITSTQIIQPSGDVDYNAGNTILLRPGFFAKNGSDFKASIGVNCLTNPTPPTTSAVAPNNGPMFSTPPLMKIANEEAATSDMDLRCVSNPFSTGTTIEYRLPEEGEVDFYLFDVNGYLLHTINQGAQMSGSHQIDFKPPNELQPGVYFLNMHSGQAVKTTKLILAK